MAKTRNYPPLPEGTLAGCIAQYHAGNMMRDIAKGLGVHVQTVAKALRAAMGEQEFEAVRDYHAERRKAMKAHAIYVERCDQQLTHAMELVWRLADWRGSVFWCCNCNGEVGAIPADRRCKHCGRQVEWERVFLAERRKPQPKDERPFYSVTEEDECSVAY